MGKKTDPLETYRSLRDFGKTPEPSPRQKPEPGEDRIFVIQKHHASHLHYDFRLEVDGVLKSWAVPKGPSTDPAQRRLAVPTEDHPLEYANFEGVIPADEYGGGTVIVWDKGTYRNLRQEKEGRPVTMEEAFTEGRIEVSLEGKKLAGGYALIRTGKDPTGKFRWLLIKIKDMQADAGRDPVKTEPESALSGKTIEEVAREGAGEDQPV